MYEKIKKWYEMGFWTDKHVEDAVEKGVITRDQADEILKV